VVESGSIGWILEILVCLEEGGLCDSLVKLGNV
jgi:hypothetical protein